jgi:putative transposase
MYWKASHCVYDCRYHIVWITKYRRKVLNKEIQKKLEYLIQDVCDEFYIKIIKI